MEVPVRAVVVPYGTGAAMWGKTRAAEASDPPG